MTDSSLISGFEQFTDRITTIILHWWRGTSARQCAEILSTSLWTNLLGENEWETFFGHYICEYPLNASWHVFLYRRIVVASLTTRRTTNLPEVVSPTSSYCPSVRATALLSMCYCPPPSLGLQLASTTIIRSSFLPSLLPLLTVLCLLLSRIYKLHSQQQENDE